LFNHFFSIPSAVMTVKKYLADLYGATSGFQYNQLSPERLDMKIKYYQEFLDVIGKVDPGYPKVRNCKTLSSIILKMIFPKSVINCMKLMIFLLILLQWRGSVLYEIHRPQMVKVNNAYESGSMAKDEFIKSLRGICVQLEESIKCLETEAEGTKEAYLAKLAGKSLTGIKELIFFSDFL
jgi:hypothetical protein